jgi:phthiocerol/phenolphthiocerol synthesis type-I polyketide synthase E
VSGHQHDQAEAVAIIGMAGRFPGADDVERFWEILRDGVEATTWFSPEELRNAGVDDETLAQSTYVPVKGMVAGPERFDAGFFGFTPREAEFMDPQHRLFLECGWESLENAGYDPARCKGPVGVFAGVGLSTYLWTHAGAGTAKGLAAGYQLSIGNDKDFLATRLSYKLGLRGPSLSVQTACSTSLVAVHLAANALLTYQCDMALAGGVSVLFPHERGYVYQEGMILSPDGHCRPFDAAAAGTVPGEGAGIVVLKRLSEAIADGDTVLAVVLGSAINNDGNAKAGYTAPSVEGQAEVIAMAQEIAGIEAGSISYVETHGTGTPIGDPIEMAALTQAFRATGQRRAPCAIGSLKANMGHLDAAAGVAGLIKTVQALRHGQIPPLVNFTQPNPALRLETSPFVVPTSLTDWQAAGGPRRAGVSSFGIGGTNAHVILEEAPVRPASDAPARRAELLVLSARSDQALQRSAERLGAFLSSHPDAPLADVAHTLQVGRKAFDWRHALVCRTADEGVTALANPAVRRHVNSSSPRPVVLMFPGQGAQRPGMGRVLYESEPAFAHALDECADGLKARLGVDIRSVMWPKDGQDTAHELTNTAIAQPAIFAVEYATAKLWESWGIKPAAMIGHSIGEFAAACLAGVFSLDETLGIVAERGRLMQSMPAGSMLAVNLPHGEFAPLLDEGLELAAINSDQLCTVSGSKSAIDAAQAKLTSRGVAVTRLETSHAFHSSSMDPILPAFRAYVAGVERRAPQVPFISCVTGTWIDDRQVTDPDYWASQLRQPVRFSDGLRAIEETAVLLEAGPGRVLTNLARSAAAQRTVVTSTSRPGVDEDLEILKAAGELWTAGITLDWPAFRRAERRHRVALPTYPFERERYLANDGATRPEPPVAVDTRLPISRWFWRPSWSEALPPSLVRGTAPPPTNDAWLVFEDSSGVGPTLATRLEARGARVTRVTAGERFVRDTRGFTISPANPDHYRELVDHLAGTDNLTRVVHLWSLDEGASAGAEGRSKGLHSVAGLVRALAARAAGRQVDVTVAGSGLHAVMADETIDTEAAAVSGYCTVVAQEHPNLHCRVLDVWGHSTTRAAELIDSEIESRSGDRTVAYRHLRRWVRRLVPIDDPPMAPLSIRERGVYVITGGLGRVGLTLAETLVAAGKARVALVGRSAFPERQDWEEEIARGSGRSAVVRRLLAMEAAGGEVMVLAADVTKPAEMRATIQRVRDRFGALHGVVHAAADLVVGAVGELGSDEIDRALGSKVNGFRALSEAVAGLPLDFAIATSSLAAVLGGLGFSAYAAANAALDAEVQAARLAGAEPAWLSVNFDAWDLGDDLPDATARPPLRDLAITSRDAAAVWGTVTALASLPQVLVSTTDLAARASRWTTDHPVTEPADALATHARPAGATAFRAPSSEEEQVIAEIWSELLGITPIGVDDNFFELGGHSLLATQIVARIRDRYRIELPLRKLFEARTVAELAGEVSAVVWAGRTPGADTDDQGEREEVIL